MRGSQFARDAYGRDARGWPFLAISPWNTPIGSGAVYSPFYATTNASGGEHAQPGIRGPSITIGGNGLPNGTTGLNCGVDTNWIAYASASDPLRTVYYQSSWDTGRGVDTTLESQYSGGPTPWQIRVPDNFIVPDNPKGNTPNNSSAIVQPDGSIWHFNVTCRPSAADSPSGPIATLATAVTTTPAAGTQETWTFSQAPAMASQYYYFKIDNELLIDITQGPGATRTVKRASPGGPAPATHTAGTNIYCRNMPYPDNFHGTPAWRFLSGDPATVLADSNIYTGKGIYGGHGGSGLSAYGGCIMRGEITGPNPIRHALSMDINGAEYLYYNWGATPASGYRWPASANDGAAPNADYYGGYHGHYPALQMGSLLAVPPSVTEASLGLTLQATKKIFHAMQDYGVYICDDTGWGSVDLNAASDLEIGLYAGEPGASWGVVQPLYNELTAIYATLQVISNNGPSNVGGGGTPRVFPAPPFLT